MQLFTAKSSADLLVVSVMSSPPGLYNKCCAYQCVVQLDQCHGACYADPRDYVTLFAGMQVEIESLLVDLPEEEVV